MIGSLRNLMFKLHISLISFIYCCEHQISLGNQSQDSAFDRSTLLFNYRTFLGKKAIIAFAFLIVFNLAECRIRSDVLGPGKTIRILSNVTSYVYLRILA